MEWVPGLMIIEHLRGGYMYNGSGKDIVYSKARTSTSMSNWGDSTVVKDCASNIIKNCNVIIKESDVKIKNNCEKKLL